MNGAASPSLGEGPILIYGGGLLANAVAQRLEAAGADVERIDVIEAGHASATSLIQRAAVLVLVKDDDAGNVDLALWARRARPDLPMVAHVFDEGLAGYLRGQVERLTILSMSQVAAPVFAEAILRVRRSVFAGAARPSSKRPRTSRRPDRVLLGAVVGLALVILPSTFYFARVLKLRPIDALYFVWTTVMTVGYGDISLRDAPDAAKVAGMLLMLAGAAFVATLFALLTSWVLVQRLDILHGRVRVRGRGHTVIVGAGNLGYRVAALLAAKGGRVVIIERDADNRNLAALRAAGHHVIVDDGTREPIHDLAGVDRAGAVLALTNSDAVNLQIAMSLRARTGGTPVVRVISPELSAHVSARGDGVALSPVAVAAEAFATAALRLRTSRQSTPSHQ